jgi:hypothetical protein
LFPKIINLDGERKSNKYKGKFNTNEFWATKDGIDVARMSATHRPHAILRTELDVEIVSSLFSVIIHNVHPHI